MRCRLRTRREGFSLVELLVVITVMGILSALTLSSFTALRSTALTVAGNNMVDVFAMARQNSIAKNDFTAVVIRTQGTGALAAYCLFEFPRQTDGTFGASATWTQLTPWRYLPKGIIFENNQSTDSYMSSSQTGSLTTTTLPPQLPSAGFSLQGSSIDLSAPSYNVMQCYQPDGAMVGEQSLQLRLIEGMADSSGNVTTPANSSSNYYALYFIGNTGLTKIQRN